MEEKHTASIETAEESRPQREPTRNYVIYTIVSVLIFVGLFYGWRALSSLLFRDYSVNVDCGSFTEEQLKAAENFTGIAAAPTRARLEHTNGGNSGTFVYENVDGDFVESIVSFSLSDVESDVRTEIYDNGIIEYVYADKYINVDNPDGTLFIYELNGVYFAEYRSAALTSEAAALFSGAEKIYSE